MPRDLGTLDKAKTEAAIELAKPTPGVSKMVQVIHSIGDPELPSGGERLQVEFADGEKVAFVAEAGSAVRRSTSKMIW